MMVQTRREFITKATALAVCAPYIPQVSAQTQRESINLHLWNDVSQSVSDIDLAIEKGGIATAMRDPYIMDAILGQKDVLAYYGEFSNFGVMRVSPTLLASESDIIAFTDNILGTMRQGGTMRSNTGIGHALENSLENASRFRSARGTAVDVVDVSGDGLESNNHYRLLTSRAGMIDMGMQCNGIVMPDLGISEREPDKTTQGYLWEVFGFYSENVRTPDGFVEVVETIDHYPMVFREKLRMELGLA